MILTPTHIDSSWGRQNGVSLLNIIMFCFCFIGLLEIVAKGKGTFTRSHIDLRNIPTKKRIIIPAKNPNRPMHTLEEP